MEKMYVLANPREGNYLRPTAIVYSTNVWEVLQILSDGKILAAKVENPDVIIQWDFSENLVLDEDPSYDEWDRWGIYENKARLLEIFNPAEDFLYLVDEQDMEGFFTAKFPFPRKKK